MNTTTSSHFVPPTRFEIFDPLNQISTMWEESFKNNGGGFYTPNSIIIPTNQKPYSLSEDGTEGTPHKFDQEASTSRHPDKVSCIIAHLNFFGALCEFIIFLYPQTQRRLAQNREAAKKSRLRKKAYVQQLETSRLKLIRLEQELDRARQQGFYASKRVDTNALSFSDNMCSGIVAFEMEYGHWVEEQNMQIHELRTVLNGQVSDVEIRLLVDNAMKHYFQLFLMKSAAAKLDVFYIMSGMWKTSAERFFLWIGGFRPSELLKVLVPHFDPMMDQQVLDVCNLRQSCQQAEDAVSQGMEKLQHTLAESVAAGELGEGSYVPQITSAMERLEALVSFVDQADHLRHETLQQMHRILTTRQAARGLLALGEYFQRLRALSSSWETRQREPT
ncbi:transcription factor TGA4-like isoform X2 [Brassica napus]|uniref:transcription factor TGA4-like isoform X2 n=1 Tax=Brassica napus TaxID=3708 RepID=UPI00207B01E1|nr:transcription factor TGA4-like isoform X2 [Brassica napus]